MVTSKISTQIIFCVLFCVCGFLGNLFKVDLFFNVDILFGSVFAMLAIVKLGRTCGIVAGFVAGTCTYLLWNHPWAIIIFTGEAVVVAWLYSKHKGNIVIYDLVYWICFGMPMVYLFYHHIMGMALSGTYVVMLKQSLNGVSNALLATIFSIIIKSFNKHEGSRTSYSELLFAVMLSFAILPIIPLSVSAIRTYQENRIETLKSRIASESEAVQNILVGWLSKHQNIVQILSSLVGDPNRSSFEEMQHNVEILNTVTPAFKGMGVFNDRSITVSYSPLVQDGKSTLGVDMSARSHIAIMRRSKMPYITDMLMSKLGNPSPIVILLAPIIISGEYKGYCSGVVETSQIAEILANLKERGIHITLVDGQNRVIVSTIEGFKTMATFNRPYLPKGDFPISQTLLWKPDDSPNSSVMQQWSGSFLFRAAPISKSCRWRVIVEAPLLSVAEDTLRYSLAWLTLQGLLVFTAIVFSYLLSNGFITNIKKLQVLTRTVPERLDDTSQIDWPHSVIEELAELSNNFQQMTSSLAKHIDNQKLTEQRITHINQVLDSIRLINKLIVYEKDRRSLLQRACNLLTETRGYRTAWAALYDDQGRLAISAESGIGENFKNFVFEMECGRMPSCYHLMKEETSSVFSVRDVTKMCSKCPLVSQYRDGAALIGVLRHNEREYGILAVALLPGMVDDENELSLFSELTGDLGYALHSLEQEEKRRQAEELYGLLFSSSSDGILIADAKTKRFRFANPAVCRFLGYTLEEIVSLDVMAIHPQENLPEILAGFESQVRDGSILMANVPCRRKDGSIVYADVNAVSIVIGNNLCLAGFFRDITARKIEEEERKKLERQLLQAQKMESVGRLAGGVAHDYNNMLSVILGYTEMAMEDIDQEQPLYEQLRVVFNAAQRSAEITRQLLAFARKQTIAPVVLNLNDTIGGMLKMLQRLLGEDISLSWNPNPELWFVKMDSSQVDQILANLCVNARDAISDVGKISIDTDNIILDESDCSDRADCMPGEYVMLAVRDTGCGMDQETLEKIYEPFYTTKEVGKGTGLGMSIVYGTVMQNSGSINIYSEPGKGTTVKIYIPRHHSDQQAVIFEAIPRKLKGNGEKLLLVEDEPTVRKMSRTMLERSGYVAFTAGSPSDAFSIAREHAGKIDLLITDVVMPEMNGKELADKLQNLYPQIKVIFMSGYTANAIAHHGVLDDGVDFIQKPFSQKELTDIVHAVLHNSKNRR